MSSSVGVAARGFRLWPEEYEELRDEARAVVRAAMDAMADSGAPPAESEPVGGYLAAAVLLRIRDELGAVGRVAALPDGSTACWPPRDAFA